MIRAGVGYDSHRFDLTRPLILGGVSIPETPGLAGHSDGDAVAHAVTDAVLGAAALGDIGGMFPDSDPANAGSDSMAMLMAAVARLDQGGFAVRNVDVTVIAERPRIATHATEIRACLGVALGLSSSAVSVKGKSNEGMGWIGRGEGLAVIAVATVEATTEATDERRSAPTDGA